MMIQRSLPIVLAALPLAALCGAFLHGAQKPSSKGEHLVYFGTYTRGSSKGIYVSRFSAVTGKLTPPELAAETANASFLAIHPNGRFLYAVNETSSFQGQKSGSVSAFSIDRATGKLTLLNQVSSRGATPAHLTVDRSGKDVLVANYGGGSVAVLPVKEDGSLAEASASGFVQHTGKGATKRQSGPNAHSVNMSPDNRFAIVADLGLDKVFVYRFDPVKGSLEANEPPFVQVAPGSGPRMFMFEPKGRFGYVINELGSTITAFAYNAKAGSLKELQTITTLPKDYTGRNATAEIQVHPTGRFVYGSNRGPDSIAVFSVDARKATLTPVEIVPTQGKEPRNFAIDPTGSFIFAANQNSNNVVLFRIDLKTGRLTPAGSVVEVGSPVCVKFLPLP
jgi:6-phosphogluconolactonase